MKISLISPYETISSFGLRIISAILRQKGHEVKLFFSPGALKENSLAGLLPFVEDSGLVGISVMSDCVEKVVKITRAVREELKIPVIWGGFHPTVLPAVSLEEADMVCVGEGENALVELAEKMERGEDYKGIKNIWCREGPRNPLRPLVFPLDILPLPDYDLDNHYILDNGRIKPLNLSLFRWHLSPPDSYTTLSSRGCNYACSYCGNNAMKTLYNGQMYFRRRSVEHLMKELLWAKQKFKFINSVYFDDDNFLAISQSDLNKFCNEYKRKIKLPFGVSGISPLLVNNEKIIKLKGAGLEWLRMGIQTGSAKIARLYNRPISQDRILEASNILKSARLKKDVAYDFILDNPYETEEDIKDTLILLARLARPYTINIFSLRFYPGTALYKKQGDVYKGVEKMIRYRSSKNTYINKLFVLIANYPLPPRLVPWLMDKSPGAEILCLFLKIMLPLIAAFRMWQRVLKAVYYKDFKRAGRTFWSKIIPSSIYCYIAHKTCKSLVDYR